MNLIGADRKDAFSEIAARLETGRRTQRSSNDENLASSAGLIPVMALAEQTGLSALVG